MQLITDRLLIRELTLTDVEFIKEIVNQESWLKFIGDKKVKNLVDAENYINSGPIKMYKQYGFGLWAVDLKSTNSTIGVCGLIKRDSLPEVDLGFAFLDRYTKNGYAYEACSEVLAHAQNKLNIKTILAIVKPDNQSSIHLLQKLNFEYKKMIQLDPMSPQINLMEISLI